MKVTDSREDGKMVRRRRRCEKCGERTWTVEVEEAAYRQQGVLLMEILRRAMDEVVAVVGGVPVEGEPAGGKTKRRRKLPQKG